MIPFPCACGKSLAVQDALAGKNVRCPACGRTVLAPQPALAPTPPPHASHEAVPPAAVPTISSPEARSRSSSADETVGANAGRSNLTSFLAPAQEADELGRLGVFRVLKVLGQGGMGAVFLAEDPKLRRTVALKVMLPDLARSDNARQRFLREAQAAASLEHDFIVPILHVGEDGGVPYIVMPLLRGMPLSDHLVKDRPLPIPEVLKIGRETAEALAAAHDHGLIHRDIKPGNIWLESSDERGSMHDERKISDSSLAAQHSSFRRVKLLDFGLAHLAVVDEQEHLTRTGALLGTPGYMSPEQVDGKELDGRSDLFSLGCVLYRLATGRPAYSGSSMTEKIVALATANPPPPSELNAEVPIEMSQLIQELFAKNPDQRPADAATVGRRLEAIERALTQPIAKPVSPRRRNWLLVGLTVALLAIGGGLLAFQQIRVTTPKGTLVIEADDPNVKVVVKKGGAVIRDKLRDREIVLEVGDYTIELSEKKDGLKLSTNKLSITRDSKETVKVWLEKPEPGKKENLEPIPPDLHRRVAEWVLQQDRGILTNAADLPNADFKCTTLSFFLANPDALPQKQAAWLRALPADVSVHIYLNSPQWDNEAIRRFVPRLREFPNPWVGIHWPAAITDEGLKSLLDVPNLKGLELGSQKVSDDGVRRLQKLTQLECLILRHVPVTDETVELLVSTGGCRNLGLHETAAAGACLPTVLKNTELHYLWLGCSKLTDDDLQKLTALKKLEVVILFGGAFTNEGIRHLRTLPRLRDLTLAENAHIDDAVFDHINEIRALTSIKLEGLKITDAGLEKVKTLPKLASISFVGTKVTAEGVAKLRAALPKLKVEWDGDAKK